MRLLAGFLLLGVLSVLFWRPWLRGVGFASGKSGSSCVCPGYHTGWKCGRSRYTDRAETQGGCERGQWRCIVS